MLDAKLLEVLHTPPDAAVAIASQGEDGPHIINSWNSYAQITEDDKILTRTFVIMFRFLRSLPGTPSPVAQPGAFEHR